MNYYNGISYPDWIEDNGEYYFTETQKTIARIHKIPNEYLEMLWSQGENSSITKKGLVFELSGDTCKQLQPFAIPSLGNLYKGESFSLEFKIRTDALKKDQILIDTRRKKTEGFGSSSKYEGNGIRISIAKNRGVGISYG